MDEKKITVLAEIKEGSEGRTDSVSGSEEGAMREEDGDGVGPEEVSCQNRLQRRSLFQTWSGPMPEVDASLCLLDSNFQFWLRKIHLWSEPNPKQFGPNFPAPAGA